MADPLQPAKPGPKRPNYYPRRNELAKQAGYKNYGEYRNQKTAEKYGVKNAAELTKRNRTIKQYSTSVSWEAPGIQSKIYNYQDLVAVYGVQGAAEWYVEWLYLRGQFNKQVNQVQHPYLEGPAFYDTPQGSQIEAPTNPGWWGRKEDFAEEYGEEIEKFQYKWGLIYGAPVWTIWYH